MISKEKEIVRLRAADRLLVRTIATRTKENPDIWSPSGGKSRRENVHSFFQYPAMMVPDVQMELIRIIKKHQKKIQSLYDPYMGSGTSLVAGIVNGLECSGQDINPLAVLLSKVKTGFFHFESFRRHAEEVFSTIASSIVTEAHTFSNSDKWFREDVAIELTKIRSAILQVDYLPARRFLWVVLAETVRLTGNDRTSTYKLHSRPLEEIGNRKIDPIHTFRKIASKNLEDLNKFRCKLDRLGLLKKGKYIKKTSAVLLDTRKSIVDENGNNLKYDLVVTSPPYGDNRTTVPYGQHAYLPLQWIDINDICSNINHDYLRTTWEIDNMSLGGNRYKYGEDYITWLVGKSPTLSILLNKLTGEKEIKKVKKIQVFFCDFFETLKNISASMNKNAYMLFTIGNRNVGGIEVQNDRISKELMSLTGLKFVTDVEREIKNKRMPSRNRFSNTMKTEKILILRKM